MARRRKMDPERKAFISSLLEHYQPKDAQDVQDMLKDLLGETLQGMLEAEMDDHLGYSKYDYKLLMNALRSGSIFLLRAIKKSS